jgi:hypothetical protein
MRNYAKLFEDFIKEEDPLAALLGDGGEEKKDDKEKKEDPIKKMQDEEKAKAEKAEDNFDAMMDKKIEEIKKKFDVYPDIQKEVGDKIISAIQSKDRVKIHNAVNDLIYLQVSYEKAGQPDKVDQVSGIKSLVDDLDKSFTNDKMM